MSINHIPTNVPPEIVYEILTYQFRDYMNNDQPSTSEKFNENLRNFLRSNLTVNKTFYHICRILIYKYCNLTTAKRFHSLLNTITIEPELRNIIQVADFQELTSIGLGRTGEMNKQIKNLTNHTLLKFLKLTKGNLREFLACEHIQDDLDDKIIHFLLKPGKVLSILDFCGCSGPNFTKSFILALRELYEQSYSTNTSTSNLIDDDNISIASFSTINSVDLNEIEDEDFHFAPDDMNINVTPLECNYQITCLGLNDCTDLPNFVLGKLLKLLPDLQKLDLARTSIDDNILIYAIPHWKNLSHLSLGNCSQITPRAILEFFSHHPAVTDENNDATLEWLNVGTISNSSSWTEVHVMFFLKKLCQFGHNKTLEYLNINGLPIHVTNETNNRPPLSRTNSSTRVPNYDNRNYESVIKTKYYYQCTDTLTFIKLNFPNLKSLSIRGNNIPIPHLVKFLAPMNESDASLEVFKDMKKHQQIKFLNISNNSHINKWSIQDPSIISSSDSLVALEVSFEAWQQIEKSNNNSEMVIMKYDRETNRTSSIKWKCYIDSSYGRRYWLYKTDKYLNREDIDSRETSLTKFDSQGNKIIEIFKQPDFLKFAQSKISLSCGLVTKSSYRRKHCYRDIKPPISQFLTRNGGIAFGNTFSPIVRPPLPAGGWRIMPEDSETNESDNDMSNSENDVTLLSDDNIDGVQNDNSLSSGNVTMDGSRPPLLNHDSSGNALFWDRSMHDIPTLGSMSTQGTSVGSMRPPSTSTMRPPVTPVGITQNNMTVGNIIDITGESDTEYLNNPELQRRRSELQLGFTRAYLHNNHNHNHRNRTPQGHNRANHNAPSTTSLASKKSNTFTSSRRKSSNYYYTHPDEFLYDPADDVTSYRYRLHLAQVHEYRTFGCVERGMYRYYSLKM